MKKIKTNAGSFRTIDPRLRYYDYHSDDVAFVLDAAGSSGDTLFQAPPIGSKSYETPDRNIYVDHVRLRVHIYPTHANTSDANALFASLYTVLDPQDSSDLNSDCTNLFTNHDVGLSALISHNSSSGTGWKFGPRIFPSHDQMARYTILREHPLALPAIQKNGIYSVTIDESGAAPNTGTHDVRADYVPSQPFYHQYYDYIPVKRWFPLQGDGATTKGPYIRLFWSVTDHRSAWYMSFSARTCYYIADN